MLSEFTMARCDYCCWKSEQRLEGKMHSSKEWNARMVQQGQGKQDVVYIYLYEQPQHSPRRPMLHR